MNAILTEAELAEQLKVSASIVRKLRATRRIPAMKVGRVLRYNLGEVTKALATPQHQPAPRRAHGRI